MGGQAVPVRFPIRLKREVEQNERKICKKGRGMRWILITG